MCMNCRNSNKETLNNIRMYFSPKKNMDYFECPICFQIKNKRIHVHVENEDWQYDRGNYRDVIRCKVCSLVLQERPHIIGFQDEGDVLETYLTTEDTPEVQTKDAYTRGRYLKNA